jgi:endogenous inhibitor of DNA gyrase (YacG/DUF329 family)
MAAKSDNASRPPRRPAKAKAGGCPICHGVPTERYRPFCSARCADIDLGRWLNESYRVPGEPVDASAETEESEQE